MRKLLILVGAAALATPAAAQAPEYEDPIDRDIVEAIPPAEEIEAMAPVMDHMVDAILDVEVGPLLDAADPYRRRYDHGAPGRTLGNIARRDDPYFEERMRSSIYGVTSDMGRMSEALAAAAPAMRRSLREFERALDRAIGDYERRRPYARPDADEGDYRRD
jgi:hypothetical protein